MKEGSRVGGRYTVERKIGEGGMGAVYAARHDGTGRKVAVKVITPAGAANPQLVARLSIEARALGKVDSDHVAQVLDVGTDEETGMPYLVMELLSGEDLSEIIERVGPMDPTTVAKIGAQIALGLESAHACDIIHRDLKPANLFVTRRDGGELRVKILDFGIAKVLGNEAPDGGNKLTRTGTVIGSPLYMSPDHVYGALSPKSDLWSLGVVLFELLSGKTPFDSTLSAPQLLMTICSTPSPPVTRVAAWVPGALSSVIEKAMRIDPGERWSSAAEMRRALVELTPAGQSLTADDLRPPKARADTHPISTAKIPPRERHLAGASHLQAVTVEQPPSPIAFEEARVAATTAPVPVVAPPRAPVDRPSAGFPARAALGAVAAATVIGIAGYLGLRGSPEKEDAMAGTLPPRAGASAASARPAPGSSSVPAAPGAAAAPTELVGVWQSEPKGRVYDAVPAGDAIEFRVHDKKQLPDQGYSDGEPRFVVRRRSEGGYAVEDRLRPLTPVGHVYEADQGPSSCLLALREIEGRPLTARLDGEDLVVALSVVTPAAASFKTSGRVVTGCVDLEKSKISRAEFRYRRAQRAP